MNLDTTHEAYLTEIVTTTVAKWGSTGSSSACASCYFQAAKEFRQSRAANGEPCLGLSQHGVALSRVGKVLERSSSASKSSREGLKANTYLFTYPSTYKMDSWNQCLSSREAARTRGIITPGWGGTRLQRWCHHLFLAMEYGPSQRRM